MQEDGGAAWWLPGLLGCGVGINECQPGRRRWEGSQVPRESGVTGLQWTVLGEINKSRF